MSLPPGLTEPGADSQLIAVRHLQYLASEQAGTLGPPFPQNGSRESLRQDTNGRHVAPPLALRDKLARHGTRFASFSIIGLVVLVLGIVVQGLMVRFGAGAYSSYGGQAIFSIELSFGLNRRFTWQERNTGFWRSCLRFNTQKLLLTVPNLALYALLIRLGFGWLLANLATTAVFTAVNYVTGDLWSFAKLGARRLRENAVAPAPAPAPAPSVLSTCGPLPTASVIIPCKGNESTIRATVDALLAQDYPGLVEVILVGDIGDSTWTALWDVDNPRLVVLEQEQTPGKRDPNVKRDAGIRNATGEILALADSDIVMDPDWLSKAISMLLAQGGGLVAGGMRSIHDTYWGRFVDGNVLAAKTPRLPQPYYVTMENFGKRGFKPPVTANAVFTRDLYRDCPLDVTWAYGYEDYEWFWRLAKGGHKILFSGELTAAHHHRRSFRKLVKEYRQSAHGCAHFIRRHSDSPLARKRHLQAFGLPAAALGFLAATVVAVMAGHGMAVVAVIAAAFAVVTAREAIRSRALEAVTYPPATLALGWVYTTNLAGGLLRTPTNTATHAPTAPYVSETYGKPRSRRRKGGWIHWSFAAILVLQAALSLSLVWSNTAFSDEALYLWAGHLEIASWLHGTPLPSGYGSFEYYFSGAPQIYSPIGALADSIGGIVAARILGLCFMLAATGFLYLTATRLFGRRAALAAAGLWAVSEPTLRLAFATYDPLSVLLMSVGTWLGIEAAYRRHHGEFVALSAAALAAGSVTAYSYAVYLPFCAAVILLAWVPRIGWKRAVTWAAWLAGAACAGTAVAATVLKLWPGIMVTTVSRIAGTSGILSVVRSAWNWGDIIICLAAAACVTACARKQQGRLLMATMMIATVLVPLNQARLETGISLDKHMAFGLWFTSMAAGWFVGRTFKFSHGRIALFAASAALITIPAVIGWEDAFTVYHLWPDASDVIAAFNQIEARNPGKVLIAQYGDSPVPVLRYYSREGYLWENWVGMPLNRSVSVAYYLNQMNSGDYTLVAEPFSIGFSTPASAQVVLTGLQQSLARHEQRAVRQELIRIATYGNDGAPGLYAFTTAVADDPQLKIAAVVPYSSHTADGIYVLWQRTASTK